MSALDFRKDILPFMIATVGEWFALFYWLDFQLRGEFLWANLLLWAGFFVERGAVILWLRLVHRPSSGIASEGAGIAKITGAIVAITVPEVVIWVGWLWLARECGYLIAGIMLAVTMLLEHSLELGLVKQLRISYFFTHPPTLFFTAVEVLAAAGWLALVDSGRVVEGGAMLLVGLSIEHVIEGATLKRRMSRVT